MSRCSSSTTSPPTTTPLELLNITADKHDDLVFRDNDAGWFPDVINRQGDPNVVRRVPALPLQAVRRVTPGCCASRCRTTHGELGAPRRVAGLYRV
nr:hypothetical protein [Deltaproteobacteria bacterium]